MADERHPSTQAALDRFAYDHLPEGPVRVFSSRFAVLAEHIVDTLPDDPTTTHALYELWKAKNCAVYVATRIGFRSE